ncbi:MULTISPECIES: biotin-dependent carboxyltransferase family protein [Sporosarcina]|uniref:Allophanate hydrolase n=1 Tax=Sporosarcina newyorkensis 2681 TaxID=1027292 RepID=F9DVQ2_9BACL|nr:biotin-dependent carboxyltransferase family protein [Sporosarcina newyorkensis]EGQ22491.1 allophanate hydrolase [Sporosarcina newyorkensis 2681]
MSFQVVHPGLLTTIQDLGRYGSQKYGVIVGGAMDSYSLRIANLLVGNDEGEGTLEMTLVGCTLLFERDLLIAITGGDLMPAVDDKEVPMWRPVLVRKGSLLSFKSARKGCRAYIAFAGGLVVPKVMGSKSTYVRAGIGGFLGRALKKGDSLSCGELNATSRSFLQQLSKLQRHFAWSANHEPIIRLGQAQTIRITEGAEYDQFDEMSKQRLIEELFVLTNSSDRMGYRLEGPPLALNEKTELLSEGVTYGTIQIPPNGQPIILMADRQTTGGYPKIAQIVSADLSSLAQLRPPGTIQFEVVSIEEAENELWKNEQIIASLKIGIQLKV